MRDRAAEQGRLDRGKHDSIGCGERRRHVAAVAGEAKQRADALRLRLSRDKARIFAMALMFAGEHENKSAHAAVKKRARNLGQRELPVPRSDAPRHQHDPFIRGNAPGFAQRGDALGHDRACVERVDIDATRDDGEPLAWNLVARDHRCRREIRGRDDPIGAGQRARPIAAQSRCGGHVGQRGDEPYGDLRCRHIRDPGCADALRVHDIDSLGGDQLLQLACAAPQLERVGRGVYQRHPLAAETIELCDERARRASDQGPRARLQQGAGDDERAACRGLFAQRRYDLQDGRARQGAGRAMGFAAPVAHGPRFLDRR